MKKSQKGFTIIEVALVLAIGALIFLVVFLATPALQRSQRNDARKRDTASVATAVAAYISDNPNKSMGLGYAYQDGKPLDKRHDQTGFAKYLDTLSTNINDVIVARPVPADTPYSYDPSDTKTYGNTVRTDRIWVARGGKCLGTDKLTYGPSNRSFAVYATLETASGVQIYCQDVQ